MFRLVLPGAIFPNITRSIDVRGSKLYNFSRPRAGQALEAYHVGNCRGQVRERGIDDGVLDRTNWGCLAHARLTLSESSHARKRLMDRWRNQFFGHTPLEHSFDTCDLLVDCLACNSLTHHLFHFFRFAGYRILHFDPTDNL